MRKQLKLKNQLDELEKIKDAISALLESRSSREPAEFEMNLIAEELFTNVMNHAFADGAEHEIKVELSVDENEWQIRLEDHGAPFDPTKADEPDINAPLHERGIGGLGIHLVRKIADVFEYERKEDSNIVVVRKKLAGD